MDRIRNEEVRRRAGIERELATRADQRVLRWFGHVERMEGYRMARAEVIGGRVRGSLGNQRNDCGGCATIRECSERVESPGTYATE